MRLDFIICGFLFSLVSCNPAKPRILYSGSNEVIIEQAGNHPGQVNLLFISQDYSDTLRHKVSDKLDTLERLECDTKYFFYYQKEDQSYDFLDTVKYYPSACKRNLSFRQINSASPVLNYLIQDFKKGSIYQLGKHGRLIHEFDSLSGFIRGFDLNDSLLAWCSDSSSVAVKNLLTNKKVTIDFDSVIRIHHDLVIHYPFLTALFSRKIHKKVRAHNIIKEGFVRVDLRSKEMKFWSIHDFLTEYNVPLRNAKGSYVTAHGNSIDVDTNGEYYISFRDLNQIWKVSPDLSKVIYRIGLDIDDFRLKGEAFIGQHSIDIISPDHFFLFDNGSSGKGATGNSRVVRISVDVKRNIYDVKDILVLPDSLSTIRMGSVQSIGEHLVISTTHKGFHILEIDTAGVVNNHLWSSESQAIKVLPVRAF